MQERAEQNGRMSWYVALQPVQLAAHIHRMLSLSDPEEHVILIH